MPTIQIFFMIPQPATIDDAEDDAPRKVAGRWTGHTTVALHVRLGSSEYHGIDPGSMDAEHRLIPG